MISDERKAELRERAFLYADSETFDWWICGAEARALLDEIADLRQRLSEQFDNQYGMADWVEMARQMKPKLERLETLPERWESYARTMENEDKGRGLELAAKEMRTYLAAAPQPPAQDGEYERKRDAAALSVDRLEASAHGFRERMTPLEAVHHGNSIREFIGRSRFVSPAHQSADEAQGLWERSKTFGHDFVYEGQDDEPQTGGSGESDEAPDLDSCALCGCSLAGKEVHSFNFAGCGVVGACSDCAAREANSPTDEASGDEALDDNVRKAILSFVTWSLRHNHGNPEMQDLVSAHEQTLRQALRARQQSRVPDETRAKLKRVHSDLDDALGDSDADWYETDDEMREQVPIQWAAKEIAAIAFARHDGQEE